MQLEILMLSEVSQKEKVKCHMTITYMWNLKYETNDLLYRNRLIDIENKLVVAKGRGDALGFWG